MLALKVNLRSEADQRLKWDIIKKILMLPRWINGLVPVIEHINNVHSFTAIKPANTGCYFTVGPDGNTDISG